MPELIGRQAETETVDSVLGQLKGGGISETSCGGHPGEFDARFAPGLIREPSGLHESGTN